jgi:hypothetical protein
LHELQQLSREAQRLAQAGVDVYLLSVDGLDPHQASSTSDAFATLHRLSVPFNSGGATVETLDKLSLVERIVLSRQMPLAVPSSWLVDREGMVSVLYRGGLNIEELLQDVQLLDLPAVARRDRAVPFAGRWLTAPKNILLRPVANIFRQHGFTADDQRYRELELELLKRRRQQGSSPDWQLLKVNMTRR